MKVTVNNMASQRHVPENVRGEVGTETQRAEMGERANLLNFLNFPLPLKPS